MASNLITKLPKGVVLGHILKVARHPQADRLNVCRVALSPSPKSLLPDPAANNPTDRLAAEGNMGRAAQTIVQIVCGAPNVAERQIVPVATVGTLLPLPEEEGQEEEKAREEESPVPAPTAVECEAGGQDQSQPETKKKKKKKKQKKKAKGFKIKKSKLRGEVSMGMICSAKELQLSEDHEGILVLGHLQLEQLSDITRRVGGGSAEEEERETTKTMEATGASADAKTDTGAARGGAKDDGEVIDLQSVHTDPLNDWIGRPLSEWIEEKNPQF